jgi:hypothetical protein
MNIRLKEARAAVGLGVNRGWPIHEDYEIADQLLRPAGAMREWYWPATHEQLPAQIAALSEGDTKRALHFARRWGLLGYQWPVPTEPGSFRVIGDHLPWTWAHARGIRLILELYDALRQSDAETVRWTSERTLEHVSGVIRDQSEGTISFEAGEANIIQDFHFYGWREDPAGVAWLIIQNLVNCNLEVLRYQIDLENGALLETWTYPSLVAMAYWHVVQIIRGSVVLARCQECHRLFVQTDRRQRYCPPPSREGLRGKAGSACGSRKRQRKLRHG